MRVQLIALCSASVLAANCFSVQDEPADIGEYRSSGGTGAVGPRSGFDASLSDSTSSGGGALDDAAGAKRCAEACSKDEDCLTGTLDQGFKCNPTTRRCEKFAEPCLADVECIPGASLWLVDCASDADCFLFSGDESCVDVAGAGKCAKRAALTDAGTDGCEFPVPDAIEVYRFGSPGTVVVCADASHKCHEGTCIVSCANTPCTPDANGSICNEETGLCECVVDDDCRGAGVSRCNTETRRCECTRDSDCDDVANTDTCVAGRCGCSSRANCRAERRFDTTSFVCE